MRSDRIMQSKIYRLFDYVLRLVLLNVLIVVPSFSLFIIYSAINKSGNNHLTFLLLIPMLLWLFPSIVATTDVIRQYENKETNTIFKDFFKSIKKLYLKSFIISIEIAPETTILALLVLISVDDMARSSISGAK